MPEMLHPTTEAVDQVHRRVFGFARELHLTLKQSDALAGLRFCQKTAFNSETVRCIDEFSMMSKRLHLDDRMHWRVFRFCQKTASNSETVRCIDGFSMMSKRLHPDDRMHWRVFDLFRCLDYRCSDEVFDCVISLSQLQM